MGAVVSILNHPTSYIPIPRNSDVEMKDEDNLLLPPNQAEFQSENNRFNTREQKETGPFDYPSRGMQINIAEADDYG